MSLERLGLSQYPQGEANVTISPFPDEESEAKQGEMTGSVLSKSPGLPPCVLGRATEKSPEMQQVSKENQ